MSFAQNSEDCNAKKLSTAVLRSSYLSNFFPSYLIERVVALASLVVDDCSKLGFAYNNRKSSNPWARVLIYSFGDSFENILQGSYTY